MKLQAKRVKNKKVIQSSQQGFVKEECLTNLIAFYNEMRGLVDKERAVVVVCPNFSKVFNTISCNNLIHKLTKYGLGK